MKIFVVILLYTVTIVFGSQTSIKTVRNRGNKTKKDNYSSDGSGRLKSEEKWVVDSIFYEDYQSDSGVPNSPDVCPPVPDTITADACATSTCQKDTDCPDGLKCCFTGCSFTCLQEIKPAAVVDWRKEPRRSRSGISWLINKPNDPLSGAETCSTSPVDPDEDPLLCPDGYFCHVTHKGNPKQGIPNSGYCVKQKDDQLSPGEEELIISSALKQRQHCQVENIVLLEGANIKLKNKSCRCKKGHLSCKSRNSKTKVEKKNRQRKTTKSIRYKDADENATS